MEIELGKSLPGISGRVNPVLGSAAGLVVLSTTTLPGTKDRPSGTVSWKNTLVKGLWQSFVKVTV